MLLESSKDLHLDLQQSAMIGDRANDLEAGINAGLNIIIQLLNGYGHSEIDKVNNLLGEIDKKNKIHMRINIEV